MRTWVKVALGVVGGMALAGLASGYHQPDTGTVSVLTNPPVCQDVTVTNPVTLQDVMRRKNVPTSVLLGELNATDHGWSNDFVRDYFTRTFNENPATRGVTVTRVSLPQCGPVVVTIANVAGFNDKQLAELQTTADETAGFELVPVALVDSEGSVYAYGTVKR